MVDEKDMDEKRDRGRPIGFRLTDESKDKIRQKRLGSTHTEETKDKISKSLAAYYKKRDSLSDSMEYEYGCVAEAVDWIVDNKEEIDDMEHVLTERKLIYLRQLEMCFGYDIDIFGHNQNPEFILMLEEELKKLGCEEELKELYSLI